MPSSALLKLLYLVSPALPIGAYAYSQGQEYAVDQCWLNNDQEIADWLLGLMRHNLATTDVAVLSRAYDAWALNDEPALAHWNSFMISGRETKELLLEDEQLAQALIRVLESHGLSVPTELFSEKPSFPIIFAYAGQRWLIPKHELLTGFIWSWLENQVAAATKTVPLGQTQAQTILMRLLSEIPQIVDIAIATDEESMGAGLPGLALSSSLHERQYSRLFRS